MPAEIRTSNIIRSTEWGNRPFLMSHNSVSTSAGPPPPPLPLRHKSKDQLCTEVIQYSYQHLHTAPATTATHVFYNTWQIQAPKYMCSRDVQLLYDAGVGNFIIIIQTVRGAHVKYVSCRPSRLLKNTSVADAVTSNTRTTAAPSYHVHPNTCTCTSLSKLWTS